MAAVDRRAVMSTLGRRRHVHQHGLQRGQDGAGHPNPLRHAGKHRDDDRVGGAAAGGRVQHGRQQLHDNSGGTLGGSGIITGTVTVASGGNLAPGASPGLHRTGSLTIASGGNYVVELNGATAGAGYDQTEVIGTVNLTGANLLATLNYVPTPGDKLYIVNNDGFDPITGTFAGLSQGSTINLVSTVDSTSYPFVVGYNGEFFGSGTTAGNDVVLIAQAVPEPSIVGLLGVGMMGFLGRRKRRAPVGRLMQS